MNIQAITEKLTELREELGGDDQLTDARAGYYAPHAHYVTLVDEIFELLELGCGDDVEADPEVLSILSAPSQASLTYTGRSGSGNLRNFKAMSDEKLFDVSLAVTKEGNDEEALEAIALEFDRRKTS